MGIPFYFKSIVTGYPDIVSGCNKKQQAVCDALYLDYNCVMHMAASKLIKEVDNDTETRESFNEKVMKESLSYIDTILEYVMPEKLLFIAVDGTCPRSKMNQQRKRRYMSVWRNTQLEKYVKTSRIWDSNIITPGTQFMKTFDERLCQYATVLEKRVTCRVVVSLSSTFGEGEHKIFHLLEDESKNNQDLRHHIIYGLDADLILLSLLKSNTKDSISLMRETPEFNLKRSQDAFLQLNITKLKESIISHHFSELSSSLSHEECIKDYVMLCSLVGNDFLPPLSYLKIKNNGLDNIIKSYKNTVSLLKKPLCSNDGLDLSVFAQITTELMKNEDEYMSEVTKLYYERKAIVPSFKTTRELVEWKVDNYPTINKHPQIIDMSSKGWRLSYYKVLFGDNSPTLINNICLNYMEGILWVFEYYFTRRQNNGWYYKFNYSPSILDLNRYMSTFDTTLHFNYSNRHHDHENFNSIISPSLHLLMVLPPQSHTLVDEKLQCLMNELTHGVLHYYPHTFSISTYLKQYLWECSVVLPDIDMKCLSDAYNSIKNAN